MKWDELPEHLYSLGGLKPRWSPDSSPSTSGWKTSRNAALSRFHFTPDHEGNRFLVLSALTYVIAPKQSFLHQPRSFIRSLEGNEMLILIYPTAHKQNHSLIIRKFRKKALGSYVSFLGTCKVPSKWSVTLDPSYSNCVMRWNVYIIRLFCEF